MSSRFGRKRKDASSLPPTPPLGVSAPQVIVRQTSFSGNTTDKDAIINALRDKLAEKSTQPDAIQSTLDQATKTRDQVMQSTAMFRSAFSSMQEEIQRLNRENTRITQELESAARYKRLYDDLCACMESRLGTGNAMMADVVAEISSVSTLLKSYGYPSTSTDTNGNGGGESDVDEF